MRYQSMESLGKLQSLAIDNSLSQLAVHAWETFPEKIENANQIACFDN